MNTTYRQPDSDPGSIGRRYTAPLDDPRFDMIDVVSPNHVELEISADGETAYVHVNGITAFRAERIRELVVTDHREEVKQEALDRMTAAIIAAGPPPFDRELSFDEAEAAGFDGTGRDGDPRFPYHESDLP